MNDGLRGSGADHGALTIQTLAATAITGGVITLFTVTANARWRLIDMALTYVATATAGTREPVVFLSDSGGNNYKRLFPTTGLIASQIGSICFNEAQSSAAAGTTIFQSWGGILRGTWMAAGHLIRAKEQNGIDAADTIQVNGLYYEQWIMH